MSLPARLTDAGYLIEETTKGRNLKGIVPLLGGEYQLDLLRFPHMIRLLSHAQIRKGRAYTLKEIAQMANPQAQMPILMQQMQALAASGIFIRGYRLACPTCALEAWYALDEVSEMTTCQGCRVRFQLPFDLSFAFRPNPLLMEALKSGALTVLLALHHWSQDAQIVLWQSGVILHKDGQTTEIDIWVEREDGIYIAECKDHFHADDVPHICDQIKRGIKIAEQIGGYFTFATLESSLPSAIQSVIDSYGIKVLTRQELLYAL